jgi:hypothetical protein
LPARSTDGLADHLGACYGIGVTGLAELDLGVFRVERAEGEPWVARVFPAVRPLAEVEGDAAVDWTGAGRGPRLWSLGFLLFAAGARSPKLVDVVISRYRRHVELSPDEMDRLPDAIRARPLLIDCWSVGVGRKPARQVAAGLVPLARLAERIADQARRAFAAPPESPESS